MNVIQSAVCCFLMQKKVKTAVISIPLLTFDGEFKTFHVRMSENMGKICAVRMSHLEAWLLSAFFVRIVLSGLHRRYPTHTNGSV